MTRCELFDEPDVELYFYGELDDAHRARVAVHVRGCADCRQRLADLRAIRSALATEPVVEAPPAGDWSGFMRRLDAAAGVTPAAAPSMRAVAMARQLVALAATLALVAIGVFMAARVRQANTAPVVAHHVDGTTPAQSGSTGSPSGARRAEEGLDPAAALREVSAEHLERSKLVVLGLAARDPHTTGAADWQYERRLAGSLLPETRLYRLTAQDRGVEDVAHVMRDLETVLLEASMSDGSDRDSLERVQRLIARRGLVSKMQIVTAGL